VFHRRGVVDERHDDLAVLGRLGLLDDHRIAVQDTEIDHRVAFDLEGVVAAPAQHGGRDLDHFVGVAQRLDRRAGGDPPIEGQGDGFGIVVSCRARKRASEIALNDARGKAFPGGAAWGVAGERRQLDDLQRAGPVGQAAQEAALFQGGDQAVDSGFRLEVYGFLHLLERG
jgi:hypothetical protein